MARFNAELLAATTVTASGVGGTEVPITTGSMATVGLKVTNAGGTTPTLNVFLEGYDTHLADWVAVPVDLRLVTDETAAEPAAEVSRINARNIGQAADITADGTWIAVYKHLPFDKVRAAWVVGGGGGETFDITLGIYGK